jgi:hypothetical protein
MLASVPLAAGSRTTAQEALGDVAPAPAIGWEIGLYQPTLGQLVVIADDGEQVRDTVFALPNPDGAAFFSHHAAVSRDGSRIVYSVSTEDPYASTDTGIETVYLAEVATGAVLWEKELSPGTITSLNYRASPMLFSADGGSFVFGSGHLDTGWALVQVTIDAAGIAETTLSQGDPAAAVVADEGFLVAAPTYNDGVSVDFLTLYAQAGGSWRYPSYTWFPQTASVDPADGGWSITGDVNALGEWLLPASDPAYPFSEEPNAGFQLTNVLQVYTRGEPAAQTSQIVPSIDMVSFAQSGELVAYTQVNPDVGITPSVVVTTRDAQPVGYAPMTAMMNNVLDLANLQDGLAIVAARQEATSVYTVDTRAVLAQTGGQPANALFDTQPDWTGDGDLFARIVWTDDAEAAPRSVIPPWLIETTRSAAVLPGFAATPIVTQLAPTLDPMSTPDLNAVPGALRQGGLAVVTTTEGDSLNVRDRPGTSGAIIATLPAGTVVRIVGLPQRVDDLTWWNIQLPDLSIGWAVDFIDDTRTLTGI